MALPKQLFILLILFPFIFQVGYGQELRDGYVFISKNEVKQFKINEIREKMDEGDTALTATFGLFNDGMIANCTDYLDEEGQTCRYYWKFKNGLLYEEAINLRPDSAKYTRNFYSYDVEYYNFEYDKNGLLTKGEGRDGDARNEFNVSYYHYINQWLVSTRYGSLSTSPPQDSIEDEYDTTEGAKFCYYPDGRLKFIVKDAAGNAPKWQDSTYFIYAGNTLTGCLNIYVFKSYTDKVQQIKAMGIGNFANNRLSNDETYAAAEHYYRRVRKKNLYINNQPAVDFLMQKTGKQPGHLIIEIANNYFLFLKIMD